MTRVGVKADDCDHASLVSPCLQNSKVGPSPLALTIAGRRWEAQEGVARTHWMCPKISVFGQALPETDSKALVWLEDGTECSNEISFSVCVCVTARTQRQEMDLNNPVVRLGLSHVVS